MNPPPPPPPRPPGSAHPPSPPPPPPPPRPPGPPPPAVPARPPSAPPILRVDAPSLKAEEAGDRIGRYKLLQQIGEGGFGVVWMAEQEKPVRRRVALKVIKLGMDTKQVIARFEAERQALAMMDHPNIAKVLDAGATQTGRPFFVMELVRGIRITEFCDQSKLSAADRLGLFISVCHAVQHAHQKGIIHRDLKPSNILVTLHDGVPVPKVIDFGVAKATQQRLTDLTLFTQFDQMIGTPLYMSPEQAEMSGLDVDTRTDVYSLGVLLYELLAGRTPFDAVELNRRGLDEMRRTIRETDPPKPSTRFGTLAAEARSTVAQQRQAEPAKLAGFLRGDLDWVVMKALEKDRTRRYETANGMAMDVQRFLNNEPVVARPPSSAYRLQKFVRRNKLAVFSMAAVALALVAAITAGVWQGLRAVREKQHATLAVANLRDTAPAFADQARALAARGQFDEAIDKLAFAAQLRPDVAAYVARQGDLRQSQLRLAKAAVAYRAALKIAADDPRVQANAALCERLLALKPNLAKPSLEVLAPLFATMQREQRAAGEQAPVAKLFAAERQRVLDEWLSRFAGLPLPEGKPLAGRVGLDEDGALTVDLSGSSIDDLRPLQGAPLGSLNLTSCANVTDLAPLAKMSTLAILSLAGTKVTDLTPLAGTRLRELNASGILARDYAPLAGLPLETLIGGPSLEDLSFLRGAPLRTLRISEGPHPRNLSALSEIKTLEALFLPPDCWKLPVAEFAAIEKLRELRMASAPAERADRVVSKEQLWREWDSQAWLRALRGAGMAPEAATQISDGTWNIELRGAKQLPDLTLLKGAPISRLCLMETSLTDLTPLGQIAVRELDVRQTEVSDLSALRTPPLCDSLRKLLIWKTKVTDFSPVAACKNLELFDAADTALENLDVIRGCKLHTVMIARTKVTDLSALAGMALTKADLDGTSITDLGPLLECQTLRSLVLPRNARDVAALRRLPVLGSLSYESASFGEPTQRAADFWKAFDAREAAANPAKALGQ